LTDTFRLACMLGDGIGPEIVPAARLVVDTALETTGANPIDWIDLPMGAVAYAKFGRAIPEGNFEELARCHGWLIGPHDSESYPRSWHDGPERVPSAELRGRYELFANIRPSRNRVGVPSRVSDVDLVIVRENTEGLYSDRNMFLGSGEMMPTPDVALTVGLFTRSAIHRVVRAAFEMAATRRKHLTIVHKANVMPIAFRMFLDEARKLADEFPDVEVDDVLFDAMAALLVRKPETFDVIVTENLFGDTLSDLAGELVGALGMSGSINAGEKYAMAQAAHGSAPDIAGQGFANPIGMIVSAAMLLRWLGDSYQDPATFAAAGRIESAIDLVLEDGVHTRDVGGTASTDEMTAAIVKRLAGQGQPHE
jgi:3-isopropylmalate dehydrogenase